MSKKNVSIVMFFILSQISFAQNKPFSFQTGFMSGFLTQKNNQVNYLEARGFSFSFHYDFFSAKSNHLRVGLGFEGFSFVSDGIFQNNNNQWAFERGPNNFQNNTHGLSFLTLPVQFVHQVRENNYIFELSAGVQAGYLVQTRHEYRVNGEKFENKIDLNKMWRLAFNLETSIIPVNENKKSYPKFTMGLGYQLTNFADVGKSFAPLMAYLKSGLIF